MSPFLKLVKIKFKNNQKMKVVQIFGKNVLYMVKSPKSKYTFSFHHKSDTENPSLVFYLKIHGIKEFSLDCFQKWIDIAHVFRAKVYIVCDDEKTKKALYKKIKFYGDFELMGSKVKELIPYGRALGDKAWYNAVLAKLAIFRHAQKQGYKNFWKIDADDTTFCMEDNDIVDCLKNAERIAQNQGIQAFSLDMHTSKLHGNHWSFGICYIDNTVDWFSIFKKYMNTNWKEKYREKFKEPMNLDLFFTYLRDEKILNIKSFYINESYFYHHADKTSPFMKCSHWTQGKLIYPLLATFHSPFAQVPIFNEVLCIGDMSHKDSDICIKKEVLKESRLYEIYSLCQDNLTVFFPPQGLGDILIVCGLLKEYKKQNPNKKIVLWVFKRHFYDLVKLYAEDIDDIILCDRIPLDRPNIINVNDLIYKDKSFKDIYDNNALFKSAFTKALGLGEKTPLSYPNIEKQEDGTLSNTILIAPDCVSCPKVIDDSGWINLADKLKEKGFEVIFNCPDETRFPSYKKVFWDIKTTIQKVNQMKAFLSYRSGLSDIVGAFCRQTPQYVIYPDKVYDIRGFQNHAEGAKAYLEFCSIKQNFDNNKVHELMFNEGTFDEILRQF